MGNETKSENNDNRDVHMDESGAAETAEIAGMTVKLQPFWPENPENWFMLAEIQFELQKIRTESARFLQVLPALPSATYNSLTDFLRNPPQDNQYTKLKTMLLNRLSPSDESQLETLLSGRDIGDRKPSEALRHIRELARENFPDKIIRSLWARRMPEVIRIAIAAQPEEAPTNTLADTADRMFEAMSAGQQINQIATTSRESRPRYKNNTTPGNSGEGTISFEQRLARIEARLDRIASSYRTRSQSQVRQFTSRSRSRPKSRSRSSSNIKNHQQGICWYHHNFGTSAQKCHKPCNYAKSTSAMLVEPHLQKN